MACCIAYILRHQAIYRVALTVTQLKTGTQKLEYINFKKPQNAPSNAISRWKVQKFSERGHSRLPRPHHEWGGGHPLPTPHPSPSAPRFSRLRPAGGGRSPVGNSATPTRIHKVTLLSLLFWAVHPPSIWTMDPVQYVQGLVSWSMQCWGREQGVCLWLLSLTKSTDILIRLSVIFHSALYVEIFIAILKFCR